MNLYIARLIDKKKKSAIQVRHVIDCEHIALLAGARIYAVAS